MHDFRFLSSAESADTIQLCAGEHGKDDIGQQWRDDPKATGSNAKDGKDQGVSEREVSNAEIETKSQDSKAKFQKAWAHMHIPETHPRNSGHMIREGRMQQRFPDSCGIYLKTSSPTTLLKRCWESCKAYTQAASTTECPSPYFYIILVYNGFSVLWAR